MKRNHIGWLLFGLTSLIGLLSMGCGGGGKKSAAGGTVQRGQGEARVTIYWPKASTRLIPRASNSIKVRLTDTTPQASLIAEQIAARPQEGFGEVTLVFKNLQPVTVQLSAVAHPNRDGTGVGQATGTTQVVIQPDVMADVDLVMDSRITAIEVTPSSIALVPGQTDGLSVTARDAEGNVVLTAPEQFQWSSLSPNIIEMDSDGILMANAPGTATIRVRDTETGLVKDTAFDVATAPFGSQPANFYEAIQLSFMPNGKRFLAADLNDKSQVLGTGDTDEGPRAVVWKDGAYTSYPPLPGFPESWGQSISNRGYIAGRSRDGGTVRATIWRNGGAEAIANPAWLELSLATSINDRGEAALLRANFNEAGQFYRGYLWQPGQSGSVPTWTELVDHAFDLVCLINNRTEAYFMQGIPNADPRTFRWKNGVRTELPVPNPPGSSLSYSRVADTNNRGDAAGTIFPGADPGRQHPFRGVLWPANGSPSVYPSVATDEDYNAGGMNDSGLFVGGTSRKLAPNITEYAFWVSTATTTVRLDDRVTLPPGYRILSLLDVNNRGEILARCATSSNSNFYFLLVPRN